MKFILSFYCLLFLTTLHAQEFTLIDTYDGLPNNNGTDDFFFEAITHQEFMYAAGTTRAVSSNGSQGDIMVVAKYNNQGQRVDETTIGFSDVYPVKMLSLANGNILISGEDANLGLILIIDTDLNIVTANNYNFVVRDVVENGDGSFTTISGGGFVLLNEDLSIFNTVDLDNANKTNMTGIAAKGSNYIVMGTLTGTPSSSSGMPSSLYGADDIVVAELNVLGDVAWSKNYGGSNVDDAFFVNIDKGQTCEIEATNDGNFIFKANTKSLNGDITQDFGNGNSDYDTWIVKINPTGDIIWQTKLGTKANEFGGRPLELANGNFIVPVSLSAFNEPQDVLDCTDCQGNVGWSCILDGQTGAILDQNWIDAAGDEFISRWVEADNRLFGFGYSESNTLAGVELDDWEAIVVEWNLSTATNDVLVDDDIEIYPNPAGNQLTVQLPENTVTNKSNLTILDVNGKIVLTNKVFSSKMTVDVTSLAKGNYLLRVGKWSGKFVKN